MSTVDKSIAQNCREWRIGRAANGLGGRWKSLELVMMVAYIHECIESHWTLQRGKLCGMEIVCLVCLVFSPSFLKGKKKNLIFRIPSLPFPGKVSVVGKSKQNGCWSLASWALGLAAQSRSQDREFPGDPVAKILSSQKGVPGFDPWPGN